MRISTHTPLAGSDCHTVRICPRTKRFQLTRPLRGATRRGIIPRTAREFQLTRPLRGATSQRGENMNATFISTHTPLAGSDGSLLAIFSKIFRFQLTRPLRGATTKEWDSGGTVGISTHTPLAGRDVIADTVSFTGEISTHTPLAGRDKKPPTAVTRRGYFNSHAPCGARL